MAVEADWYRRAVIYSVDVRRFVDSDGDGVGDFQGLISRLDYLDELGITCLWLLPFFPSPERDGGYDVTDYYHVDPRLGTLDDFVTLCQRAGERGIRVLVDVPANHTSDEHPWFQAARRDPRSRFRDYYIWSPAPPPSEPKHRPLVGDVQSTPWKYDEVARSYYYHKFYDFQPDLDLANEEVRAEILRILDFWLALGGSGFRLDAVPHVLGKEDPPTIDVESPHGVLKQMRERITERRPDAVLFGEVDEPVERLVQYFGDGDELHVLFNFLLSNYMWLGITREDRGPIARALQQLPEPPNGGQWANFLRNHDELDLGQLDDEERAEVFAKFAPRKDMRIYDRGIRRRLAPILGGNERRIRMALSLLLTLPGAPVILYGDEIGMGDDPDQPERMAVRVPMQWSDGRNAGFSDAQPSSLVQPVVTSGPFSHREVNVERQRGDEESLLKWLSKAIQTYRQCPEFSDGSWQLFETTSDSVLAHRCTRRDGIVVAVHNLSRRREAVTLDLRDQRGREIVDLLNGARPQPLDGGMLDVALEPYGFRWYRVVGDRAD